MRGTDVAGGRGYSDVHVNDGAESGIDYHGWQCIYALKQ